MTRRFGWGLAAAVVAAAVGCAGRQETSEREQKATPAARQIEASQARSQQALDEAAKAQQQASEQSRKAQEARRAAQQAEAEARAAQERAVQATQRWRDEQARAVQAQQVASRATQEAARVAQAAQAQASEVLAGQGPRRQGSEQLVSGQVTGASGDRITITSRDGVQRSFGLTPRTQVRVDGEQASPARIQQGDDARVAYDPSSGAAVRVEIESGGGR